MASISTNTQSELAHKFSIFAGGVLVLAGALKNTFVVRPFCNAFAKATGKGAACTGSFANDIMPLRNE